MGPTDKTAEKSDDTAAVVYISKTQHSTPFFLPANFRNSSPAFSYLL